VKKHEKLLRRILDARSDNNIAFDALRQLLLSLGFEERTRGSHYIFRRRDVEERLNLQEDGALAKPYQVRQVRGVILRHRLGRMLDE
jgi:hypothetical protein